MWSGEVFIDSKLFAEPCDLHIVKLLAIINAQRVENSSELVNDVLLDKFEGISFNDFHHGLNFGPLSKIIKSNNGRDPLPFLLGRDPIKFIPI